MKIRISQSFGYAGTSSYWEEEVPDEIAEQGQESDAFKEWFQDQLDGHWDDMCQKLELSIRVVEGS